MLDEWRSTITAHGEQFVMTTGTLTMLMLSADNLVFVMRWMLIRVLVMAWELGRFCLMTLVVWVMSRHYFRAEVWPWDITTVITVKTLAFDVKTLEVTINDYSFIYSFMLQITYLCS